MIHTLPKPVRGNTHAQIVKREDHPSSGVVLTYRFGAMVDGTFAPDQLIAKVRRHLDVRVSDRVRGRAAGRGAPTTNGEQEYRMADLLAVMDNEGLWDPTVTTGGAG